MHRSNPYSVFARYYDELMGDVDYPGRAVYFDSVIKRNGVQGGVLLDLACGTGSLSYELAKLGYEVIGVDASPDMLSVAAQKGQGADTDATPPLFLCQRMEELDLYGTVDACVCALDSLNHLTPGQFALALTRVSLFLRPGGVFVFDLNTVHKHKNVLGSTGFVKETPNVFCAWQNWYEQKEHKVSIELDFFERSGEHYTRSSESFCEYAYPLRQVSTLLKKAGLRFVAAYDQDSTRAPRRNSERMVVVTKKPSPAKSKTK